MRRGEIGITVVVIIALALIVLVTLAAMLGGIIDDANETLNECERTFGGTCMIDSLCQAQGGRVLNAQSCNEAAVQTTPRDRQLVSFPEGGTICCVTD